MTSNKSFLKTIIVFCYIGLLEFNQLSIYAEKETKELQYNILKPWSFVQVHSLIRCPAVADLNNDGYLEVLVGSYDQTLYCLSKDGDIINTYKTNGDLGNSSPAIADLDGEGDLEIIMGSSSGIFCCLDKNLDLVWQFNSIEPINTSPAICDLDGNGRLEVLFGAGNYLFCLDSNGKNFIPRKIQGESSPISWPMFHHDLENTGYYSR